LLPAEATYQAEIINIAKYLNTKYKEDVRLLVSRVKSHEHSQPNIELNKYNSNKVG